MEGIWRGYGVHCGLTHRIVNLNRFISTLAAEVAGSDLPPDPGCIPPKPARRPDWCTSNARTIRLSNACGLPGANPSVAGGWRPFLSCLNAL